LKIESKDPYFGGKELARTARLIEIADLVNDAASKQKAKDVLVNELDSFWFGISSGTTGLVYEPTWGGIVSRGSVGSAEADFGQYYYNDHHFHYGYFVNAFATLAKHYPAYYNSRLQYINPILDDFAGTCLNSALPCRPRNKDPFLGHSYAAGIFEFADSRNQESTSEAVNSYFAVRELGKALQNSSLEDLGDYLLSTELVATQTYWQIKSPSDIYASPFADNGVVGILWETKVDYATFFGANVEFIYGIQMLPFNEMTPAYLDQDWLRATKTVWGKGLQSPAIEEGWKGFLLLADALIDPAQNGLSLKIHSLTAYDNGNTETNTLYFYYMVGGTTDTTVVQTTTKPTSGSSSTTGSSGGNLLDQGKPDPGCGPGLLGCHSLLGTLVGCYNIATHGCYLGGNICVRPYVPCLNTATFISPGAACYDQSLYACVSGQLIFIGGGIIG